MVKLSKIYPELFHYTTLANLASILDEVPSKRCLWATHFGYVNDSSEAKAYFDRRLPTMLKECLRPTNKLSYTEEELIKLEMGLAKHLERGIFKVIEPYIISFSGASNAYVKKNGLLSQWRGYGTDGGCAIVFKTTGLEKLAKIEQTKYYYSGINLCRANYYDHVMHKYDNPEMYTFERTIKEVLQNLRENNSKNVIADTLTPLVDLAIRHKHFGFKEEREVRIIALPTKREHLDEIETKSIVDYSFYNRKGAIVPHLKLFQNEELPIKRIIIGPHPNQIKRVEAIQKLLVQRGLSSNIDVVPSDIPYIG